MNKRGQWNIGIGTSLILGGIYLLTRGTAIAAVFGIIFAGAGTWLIFLERKKK